MVIRRATKIEVETSLQSQTIHPDIPTVSEFTRRVRGVLEGEFQEVVVQGEISGWNRAASGHTYFTLRDEYAALGAVLWRNRQMRFPIRDGMRVVATGRITLYEPRGQYQLDCVTIVPLGQGELHLAFEALKAKLQAEGLFDRERKRPLPMFPRRIGVVTSRDGAALRDIVTTIRRRMPTAELFLCPTLVQGATAAAEIATAIRALNERPDIDLMIVGRGGGAMEDLWAFNEEIVARAIADSRIPIISAVGHETDFTIADFVADVRAATPTAAAELAVRDRAELLGYLRDVQNRLSGAASDVLRSARRELTSLLRSRGLARPLDMVRSHQQRLDDLSHRSSMAVRTLLRRRSEQLDRMEASLRALNPANVMARGYAIVEQEGSPVTSAESVAIGDSVTIRWHDGRQKARIVPPEDQPTP